MSEAELGSNNRSNHNNKSSVITEDEVSESHDKSNTIESLQESLKQKKWNFLLLFGIAVILLVFALFPMPLKIDYNDLTGTAEKDIGYVWGPSPPGDDIIDSSFQLTVEIIQLPTTSRNMTLEVFVLKINDCFDSSVSDIEITARSGSKHDYQYAMVDSPVEGKIYKLNFDLDLGQYCLTVKLVDESGTVVDPSSTKLNISGKLWPNRVIGGVPGSILLICSFFMYLKTRKISKKLTTLTPKKTESQNADLLGHQKRLPDQLARLKRKLPGHQALLNMRHNQRVN